MKSLMTSIAIVCSVLLCISYKGEGATDSLAIFRDFFLGGVAIIFWFMIPYRYCCLSSDERRERGMKW